MFKFLNNQTSNNISYSQNIFYTARLKLTLHKSSRYISFLSFIRSMCNYTFRDKFISYKAANIFKPSSLQKLSGMSMFRKLYKHTYRQIHTLPLHYTTAVHRNRPLTWSTVCLELLVSLNFHVTEYAGKFQFLNPLLWQKAAIFLVVSIKWKS